MLSEAANEVRLNEDRRVLEDASSVPKEMPPL